MIYEENFFFLVETIGRDGTGGPKVQRADRRHNEVIIMFMMMRMMMMMKMMTMVVMKMLMLI